MFEASYCGQRTYSSYKVLIIGYSHDFYIASLLTQYAVAVACTPTRAGNGEHVSVLTILRNLRISMVWHKWICQQDNVAVARRASKLSRCVRSAGDCCCSPQRQGRRHKVQAFLFIFKQSSPVPAFLQVSSCGLSINKILRRLSKKVQ